MDPLPKSDVAIKLARNIQLVWLRKLGLVLVRRAQRDYQGVAFFDGLPGEFQILGGKTRRPRENRPVEAQEFFDCRSARGRDRPDLSTGACRRCSYRHRSAPDDRQSAAHPLTGKPFSLGVSVGDKGREIT
jgi:hypothetical protein